MRVLIYVPISPQSPKVFARCIQSVFRMEWLHPCEIVFGREDEIAERPADYEDLGWREKLFVKDANITKKYNWARQMALDGGYDALFTVESDVILPDHALQSLSKVDADVAYGLYVSRHGKHEWLCFLELGEKYGKSLSENKRQMRRKWGWVVESAGVGMGCTLIHRRVLERLEFRRPPDGVACDWFFSIDLQHEGFVQKHDLDVVCGHIDLRPSPRVYWPDPFTPMGYSIEFLDIPEMQVPDERGTLQVVVRDFNPIEIFRLSEEETPGE